MVSLGNGIYPGTNSKDLEKSTVDLIETNTIESNIHQRNQSYISNVQDGAVSISIVNCIKSNHLT